MSRADDETNVRDCMTIVKCKIGASALNEAAEMKGRVACGAANHAQQGIAAAAPARVLLINITTGGERT